MTKITNYSIGLLIVCRLFTVQIEMVTLGQFWNWREEAKLLFILLVFNFSHFSSKWLFWSWARCIFNNIWGIEWKLWWIENIDSRIFQDTQCIIQEIESKNMNMEVLKTTKFTSKVDGFITLKHAIKCLPFVGSWIINEYEDWASGEVSQASNIWEFKFLEPWLKSFSDSCSDHKPLL